MNYTKIFKRDGKFVVEEIESNDIENFSDVFSRLEEQVVCLVYMGDVYISKSEIESSDFEGKLLDEDFYTGWGFQSIYSKKFRRRTFLKGKTQSIFEVFEFLNFKSPTRIEKRFFRTFTNVGLVANNFQNCIDKGGSIYKLIKELDFPNIIKVNDFLYIKAEFLLKYCHEDNVCIAGEVISPNWGVTNSRIGGYRLTELEELTDEVLMDEIKKAYKFERTLEFKGWYID